MEPSSTAERIERKQSAASQVWGIGHLRETILDECASLFSTPVQKSQFFRKCISRLDKASVRECARHTHAAVYLDKFPWDCPDSVRTPEELRRTRRLLGWQ